MKIEEIRSKPDAELEFELKKIERNLFDLRFKASIESIASPAEIKTQRRSIARIKTVLHERASGVRGQEIH